MIKGHQRLSLAEVGSILGATKCYCRFLPERAEYFNLTVVCVVQRMEEIWGKEAISEHAPLSRDEVTMLLKGAGRILNEEN